ncbi:MAG: hypothetical protein IT330_07175 [Anaerolineae bacterium]|nr:hypothetical protein [Anaerolineae bacterium]
MKYPSTISPNGFLEKPSTPETDAFALLESGIALCARWEELAARQFSALKEKDLQTFSVIHVSQLHLADQLYDLELRWQKIIPLLQEKTSLSVTGQGASVLRANLKAKWNEFVAAAQRASAANFLNAKALAASTLLQAACEPLAAAKGEKTYDRHGRSRSPYHSLSLMTLDREG